MIAGRHIGKGCPGIILPGLTVPGKWQRAISVPRGECNLHAERYNQKQTTQLYKLNHPVFFSLPVKMLPLWVTNSLLPAVISVYHGPVLESLRWKKM